MNFILDDLSLLKYPYTSSRDKSSSASELNNLKITVNFSADQKKKYKKTRIAKSNPCLT